MKYIMLKRKVGDMVQEVPIIFPDFIVHKHMASAIKNFGGNVYNIENVVASAGDIIFEEPKCSGGSETLKIKSRECDDDIIAMYDYSKGFTYD